MPERGGVGENGGGQRGEIRKRTDVVAEKVTRNLLELLGQLGAHVTTGTDDANVCKGTPNEKHVRSVDHKLTTLLQL